MAKKQPSFSDLDYDNKKKTTRKDLFLQKMNEVIPWEVLLKPIRREYPQGALGRPPIALGKMLRIYFMQQWYHLGDPAMEDMLYDSASMKRFVGISIDEVPDETTLMQVSSFFGKPQANGVPILIIAVILGRTRLAITRRDDSGCEHHRSPELNKE